ncbi:PadR family transcriptional regulator [Microbacterium sp. CJ88]|uniref:PadR family transcriptional regulator n=1 Tax=Microbacterium sp. CJ88 TaxID=3445672 RepID=UPI003F655508
MSGSFLGDGFPGRGRGPAGGWPMTGLWEALEQFRGQFEQKAGPRAGRGDVRAAVLALLAEKPMHGYQIIREIEERSSGSWKPSPGSVYPTLQLLTDEGLVAASESDGRKTYALTEAGRAVADEDGERSAPWESAAPRDGGRTGALPKAGIDLAQAVAQVGRSGSSEQVKQSIEVLEEARRKIFTILAQD